MTLHIGKCRSKLTKHWQVLVDCGLAKFLAYCGLIEKKITISRSNGKEARFSQSPKLKLSTATYKTDSAWLSSKQELREGASLFLEFQSVGNLVYF